MDSNTPTLDEVKAFASQNNLVINAENFYRRYNNNGWKLINTGNPVKIRDWKGFMFYCDRLQRKANADFDSQKQTLHFAHTGITGTN